MKNLQLTILCCHWPSACASLLGRAAAAGKQSPTRVHTEQPPTNRSKGSQSISKHFVRV